MLTIWADVKKAKKVTLWCDGLKAKCKGSSTRIHRDDDEDDTDEENSPRKKKKVDQREKKVQNYINKVSIFLCKFKSGVKWLQVVYTQV